MYRILNQAVVGCGYFQCYKCSLQCVEHESSLQTSLLSETKHVRTLRNTLFLGGGMLRYVFALHFGEKFFTNIFFFFRMKETIDWQTTTQVWNMFCLIMNSGLYQLWSRHVCNTNYFHRIVVALLMNATSSKRYLLLISPQIKQNYLFNP